jgi:hypothetical protein
MTIRVWRAQLSRGVFAASLGACVTFGTVACTSNEYAGISLKSGAAVPELQQLAQRARAGDKQAQLDLGIRYEEGRGVAVDSGRAAALYRKAATASGGTLWVYSPGSGKAKGRVVAIDSGPRRAGLSEAKSRLSRLTELAGARAISNIDFGGGSAVTSSARGDSLATNSGTPARLPQELPAGSQDVLVGPEDVPIGRPEEGMTLLRACRSKPELDNSAFAASDPFNYGFCQGYILSKVSRLSQDKLSEIEVRRRHMQGDIPPADSWIMLDILNILRSSQFDDRSISQIRGRLKGPITAENVLDYIVDNLLYVEPR